MLDENYTKESVLANAVHAFYTGFSRRFAEQKRPHVTLKLATSLDGRVALINGTSQWITGHLARNYAHSLRANHDAIMVGSGTVIADNPRLTCRLVGLESRSPIRIVMAGLKSLSPDLQLLQDDHPSWIFSPNSHLGELGDDGSNIRHFHAPKQPHSVLIDMHAVMHTIAEQGIQRLLVEGGSHLATSLIKDGLVDTLIIMQAGKTLGGDAVPLFGHLGIQDMDDALHWERTDLFTLGNDTILTYKPATR